MTMTLREMGKNRFYSGTPNQLSYEFDFSSLREKKQFTDRTRVGCVVVKATHKRVRPYEPAVNWHGGFVPATQAPQMFTESLAILASSVPNKAINRWLLGTQKMTSRHFLNVPNRGYFLVEYVLSQLEQGNIQEASFRCFLDDLESTSLRDYASLICDKLFLVVERNLTLSEEQAAEVAALGCVIRKLVFNLTDEGIPRIVNLLNNAEKKRGEHNATSVEMLMYKSLVDRFEFRPIFRNKGIKPIADRCYQTISQFGQAIDSKAERTQVVLIDALLGFACYATEDQIAECSLNINLPGHLGRFLSFMGGKIQNAIAQKISEQSLRRDILSFIKDLKNENNLS